jgi:hypothetical protein
MLSLHEEKVVRILYIARIMQNGVCVARPSMFLLINLVPRETQKPFEH